MKSGILRLMAPVVLLILGGCQSLSSQAHTAFVSADLLRSLDSAGINRNDQRTLTSPDDIARLQSYFPDLGTNHTSSVHGPWQPWIIIRFRTKDETDTYIQSDYRLYRINDGRTGDFVVNPGFIDQIDRFFAAPQ